MPGKYNTRGIYWHPQTQIRRVVGGQQYGTNPQDQAKSLQANGYLFFSSTFELDCYELLIHYFGVLTIDRQPELTLLGKTGRMDRAIKWRVDFRVNTDSLFDYSIGRPIYIETKGVSTEAFVLKKNLFYSVFPEEILWIVHNTNELVNLINAYKQGYVGLKNKK